MPPGSKVFPTQNDKSKVRTATVGTVCWTPSTEFERSPVRSSHCVPSSAGKTQHSEVYVPLTTDASGPTTVHPVMPVEPAMKLSKDPAGTTGASKLPLVIRLAWAETAAARIQMSQEIFIRFPSGAKWDFAQQNFQKRPRL